MGMKSVFFFKHGGGRSQSYHIDTGALHFIEERQPKKDNDYTYQHTNTDLPEKYGALAHEGEPEGFDDEDHGVQGEKPAEVLRDRTQRIGDATGIHPELHEKAKHDLQVTKSGGEARDEATDPKAERRHL